MENEDIKIKVTQIVYLKTDPDQFERIVTAKIIRAGNITTWELTLGPEDPTVHHISEISIDKDVSKM